MKFQKYQGTGNDFVMVVDMNDELRLSSELVRALCDRRFGVGADGVIRVAPSEDADFLMDYVNSDGSVGEVCGNGIRCLAVLAHDLGLTTATELKVATGAGLRVVELTAAGVRVNMGAPAFSPADVPVEWDGPDALHAKLDVDGELMEFACLSFGNAHAVTFVGDVGSAPVTSVGPRVETHTAFPRKANVEFAHVESPKRVAVRVWERGSGETAACGTGACAVAVAVRLLAGADGKVTVAMPGGELLVEWPGSLEEPAPVTMTGAAHRVFAGEVDPQALIRR